MVRTFITYIIIVFSIILFVVFYFMYSVSTIGYLNIQLQCALPRVQNNFFCIVNRLVRMHTNDKHIRIVNTVGICAIRCVTILALLLL